MALYGTRDEVRLDKKDVILRPIDYTRPHGKGKDRFFEIVLKDKDADGEPIAFNRDNMGTSPTFAIDIEGHLVGTVSTMYCVIQHVDLKEQIESVLLEQRVGFERAYARYLGPYAVTMCWDFGEQVIDGETFHKLLTVTNSLDATHGIVINTCLERMVCSNGLYLHVDPLYATIPHKSAQDATYDESRMHIMNRVSQRVVRAIEHMDMFENEVRDMKTRRVTGTQLIGTMNSLNVLKSEAFHFTVYGVQCTFDKRGRVTAINSVEGILVTEPLPETEWDAFQMFTQMAHEASKDLKRQMYIERTVKGKLEKHRDYGTQDKAKGILFTQ